MGKDGKRQRHGECIFQAAAIVGRYDRKLLPLSLALELCGSILPYFNTFMTGLMIDWLILGRSAREIAFLILTAVSGRAVFGWLRTLLEKCYGRRSFYMEKRYMADKSLAYMKVPYERLESVEFTDLRQKIRYSDDNMGTFAALAGNFRTFFGQLATALIAAIFLAFMLVALAAEGIGGVLLFLLAAAAVGGLTMAFTKCADRIQEFCGREVSRQYEELTKGNRLAMYMAERIVFDYQMGKDLRLYGAAPIIEESDRGMVENMDRVFKKICMLLGLPGTVSGVGSGLVGSAVYMVMALWAALGYITVGNVVVYTNSVQSLVGAVGAISLSMGRFSVLLGHLAPVKTLLWTVEEEETRIDGRESAGGQFPAGGRAACGSVFGEICFSHVFFRYPGTEKDVLRDVSFTIREGERVSIVGANGAGKSTAVKLLCRLYRPDAGTILIDGVDIQTIPEGRYRHMIAPVFQNFRLFSFTLGENLSLAEQYDRKKAEFVLNQVGFGERLKASGKGLDTILFHDYDEDGMECSGGEVQKIALARCLYAEAPILVLDEPTSALDARAEMEVYENFCRACGGKTAIFISHRLSSCRFSDRILVFAGGRLVQNGSHEALVAEEEGPYSRLWNAQAQYYR